MTTRTFFKGCLVMIFLNTIVEKHTLNPEITLLYRFHAQKYLFEVPKICNIDFFLLKMTPTPSPPPLELFQNSSHLVHQSFP